MEIHSIPCEVVFRGVSDIQENFSKATTPVDLANIPREARLRGRFLKGASVVLPSGYVGGVLRIAPVSSSAQSIAPDQCAPQHTASEGLSSTSKGTAPKNRRDWLVADEDDSGDIFAARFRVEEKRLRSEKSDATCLGGGAQQSPNRAANTKKVLTLPAIPSAETFYPTPICSSNLSDVARRSIVGAPSSFKDDEGKIRCVSKTSDVTCTQSFASIVIWEHDHNPSAQDTDGFLAWINLADVLHRCIE